MTKILVVDDLESNRTLLHKMLKSISRNNEYEVIEADSGDAAVRLYVECNPDLILMDYNMPIKTGCEAAREIKAMAGEDYTPIIFITAMRADSVLQEALSSGGDDYIGKPFEMGVLKSKINAHLRIRELNSKLIEKNLYLTREQELIEHFFENALNKSFLDRRYINYHTSSLSAFNGDILLSQKGPDGGLYLLVGDFTGHGLSAAMGTLPVAMIFFKMTKKGLPLDGITRELNSQLHAIMPSSMFFAATLIHLDNSGSRLSLWMGGMPECIWMDSERHVKGNFTSKHMPLGILDDEEFEYESEVVDVVKGDKIYVFSDGVTEAKRSYDGVMFGHQLEKVLKSNDDDDHIKKLLRELKNFTDDSEQSDDITMVELTCDKIVADMALDSQNYLRKKRA